MSRREDIDNAIWSDPDFEALTLPATALYLWSFTNPRCGMAGIYKVSRRAMGESKVDTDDLDRALAELADTRFMFYETGVLFVRARVKHMRQRTLQIAKSIRTDITKIAPDHPMRALWVEENARAPWLVRFLGDGWDAAAVPDGESLVTFGGPLGEVQVSGSLEPISRRSSKGRSTLHGNGNGKGTGKGPLGRGVGREPTARAKFEEMVDREFPGVPLEAVRLAMAHLRETTGTNPDTERVRRQLADDGYIDERNAA